MNSKKEAGANSNGQPKRQRLSKKEQAPVKLQEETSLEVDVLDLS